MISVLIPTYRRPSSLAACLEGLDRQTVKPLEVVLVVRNDDHETRSFLASRRDTGLNIRIVTVSQPGVVIALNTGLDHVSGEYIAITDDDTVPRPDWLERIIGHFEQDPLVGGVGGRDWVHEGGKVITGNRKVVGKLQWFGRAIGNHHLGAGPPREVDFLKGANMSYRRSAIQHIRIADYLKGQGAQVCNDMEIAMAVKQAGWKLIYDPLVAVDHYPAQRHDEDQRNQFNPVATYNSAYNETMTVAKHLPLARGVIFFICSVCIGTSGFPGFVQWIRLLVNRTEHATAKYRAVQKGRFHAFANLGRMGIWRRSAGTKLPVGGDPR